MSLRSRLLAGMALVAIVLVGAATVITSTAHSALVDRVDAQLTAASISPRGGVGPGEGNGGAPGSVSYFTNFYVGSVGSTGHVSTVNSPEYGDTGLPLPKFSAQVAVAATSATPKKPFTVGRVNGSGQWRVLATLDNTIGARR